MERNWEKHIGARLAARLRTLGRMVLLVSLLPMWAWGWETPALAAPPVTVRVIVERVLHTGSRADCRGQHDYYTRVTMDGERFRSRTIHNNDDILPEDWEFVKSVDPDVGSIAVVVELWESDSRVRCGDDDHVDINPREGRNLGFVVNLAPCGISGDVSGGCGATLESEGDRPRRARIWFRVEVSAPPGGSGLNLSCLHDPIWPQATDAIAIEAATFDENMRPTSADIIEIWVDERSGPRTTCSAAGTCTTGSLGPFAGPTIAYACRAQIGTGDLAIEAWSGWRQVQVGLPASGRSVPVLFTGPRTNRVDIVFIPDEDSYTGTSDSVFLADVHNVIKNGYYFREIFLRYQDKLNFWLALDTGDVDPPTGSSICPRRDVPRGWSSDYAFADTGAILHREMGIRDCAWRDKRIFSGTSAYPNVILHETGHSPFGLADEYCCDGGYFRTRILPNIYRRQPSCMDDARRPLVEAEFGPDACQQIVHPYTGESVNWFRLDSASTFWDDLMVYNGKPQVADESRIEWFFNRCSAPGERC